MIESVPSLFHCPMSPVLSHPSSVIVSRVTSSRLSGHDETKRQSQQRAEERNEHVQYPLVTEGPRMRISP